jgi:hypothetical protein
MYLFWQKWVGLHFGQLFTNSSGHPAPTPPPLPKVIRLKKWKKYLCFHSFPNLFSFFNFMLQQYTYLNAKQLIHDHAYLLLFSLLVCFQGDLRLCQDVWLCADASRDNHNQQRYEKLLQNVFMCKRAVIASFQCLCNLRMSNLLATGFPPKTQKIPTLFQTLFLPPSLFWKKSVRKS